MAESCALALRLAGHEVSVAHDGASALQLITDQLPDVVVSDIRMPVMDGEELSAALRAQPSTAHIPVILFSGHGSPSPGLCDAFFSKPFQLSQLTATVSRLAASGRSRDKP